MATPQYPPGWYQNPQGPGQRYWDGTRWTDSYAGGPSYSTPGSPQSFQQAPQPQAVYVQQRSNGLAVAALVCGLVGIAVGLVPILFWAAWGLGVTAVALGLIARGRANRDPSLGRRTMATWGVVLGVGAVALGIAGIAIVDDAFNDLEEDLEQTE